MAFPGTAILTSTFSTSTFAPFANVTTTLSSNSTIPTPAPTSVSCPSSRGTFYTDPSTGSTFEIECGSDNTATAEPVSSEAITVQGATLQDCIGFCAMMRPSCQGVDMRNGTCYLETESEEGAGRVEGARLVKNGGR